MEGMLQKVGDVEFVYYKQLGGDMIRLDIFKGDISHLEEYKDYEILEAYKNGDRITHYLKPKPKKEKVETYTDTTGITYKTSSIFVYTDRDGKYRTFSDDTRKHLEHHEKNLLLHKELLEKEINSLNPNQKDIDRYKRWIKDSEKHIEKYKKDLMKGL